MRYLFWIAWRNAFGFKSAFLVKVLRFFSIASIAAGVGSLIVVLSVMSGFDLEQRRRLSETEFHIRLEQVNDEQTDSAKFGKQFWLSQWKNDPQIVRIEEFQSLPVVVMNGAKVGTLAVKSFSPQKFEELLTRAIDVGSSQRSLGTVWIGQELAIKMELSPDSKLKILNIFANQGPLGLMPDIRDFSVAGIFRSGVSDQETDAIYIAQSTFQKIFGRYKDQGRLTSGYELYLSQPSSVGTWLKEQTSELRNHFRIVTWMDVNQKLLHSLQLERVGMALGLGTVLLVGTFNILTLSSFSVSRRRRDIGILKAMGMSMMEIRRIFLLEATVIGTLGILVGGVLGFGVCSYLKYFSLLELPDFFFDRKLPVDFQFIPVAVIAVGTIFMTLLGAWIPALAASRLSPAEAIRSASLGA